MMRARSSVKLLMTVLGLGLLAVQAVAGESTVLKTDKDKTNYSIGVNIIRNIKQQGIDIDLDLVIQGMKDDYAGGDLLVNEEELSRGISQYQTAVRQRRSQAMAGMFEENKREGETFLKENKKKEGVVTLPSGLQYKVIKAGDGKRPSMKDTVECNYRGTLIDGTEFDSSYRTGKTASFKVSQVIPGWQEALQLMTVGSSWRIFVPSQLAYGKRGHGGTIGPNATLVFEIELLGIQ